MNSEQIEEIASRWLARQLSGEWMDADQVELDAWLDAATVNRVAYIRLATAWKRSARIAALGAGVAPGVIPARGSWGDTFFSKIAASDPEIAPVLDDDLDNSERAAAPSEGRISPRLTPAHRRWARWRLFAAAALVLVVVGVAYPYVRDFLNEDRYSTSVGGLSVIHLVDGSEVTLNTDTKLRVVITPGQRRIDLDKGEAFFVVAHDRSRPFVVYVGTRRLMAVGTQFAVRRESDDVRVVVTEGRVSLTSAPLPALPSTDTRDGATYPPITMLPAGTIARTAKTEIFISKDSATSGEELLSWRKGFISFKNTALADAVNEFNRYNTRKMVIDDPGISAIRIGGNFRTNNIDAFLWLLQNGFPIRVVQDKDKIFLRTR
jgi:transmembrane sensor